MSRKLVVLLLVGVTICLMGVSSALGTEIPYRTEDYIYATLEEYEKDTEKTIVEFFEAPDLRVKVAAGELPPVEERLPEQPLVIKPVEKMGQYGGTLTTLPLEAVFMRMNSILKNNNNFTEALPWLASSYEMSEDKKTVTLHLRKGVKWSDGHPFTVEDIFFWWEDVLLNDELTPVKSEYWTPGGELARFEKVDDYTLRIHYAAPFWVAPLLLGGPQTIQGMFYTPKHYLSKWHIKYNPEADKLAKEEGYEYWWQAFNAHNAAAQYSATKKSIGLPILSPWMVVEVTAEYVVSERNPYFFAIDSAGNQLPYIDKILTLRITNLETQLMKAVAGEVDHYTVQAQLSDYPLLKENEEKGGYRVMLTIQQPDGSGCWFAFNQNHPDPVKRKIFQDVRFRRAMSLAINREEINEMYFFGVGTPAQVSILPTTSFYKEEWAKAWAQYNPEEANRLLDEVGLDKRDAQGYRLRPDGKRLSIVIEYWPAAERATVPEPVAKYWEAVGIRTQLKPGESGYIGTRKAAGELDVPIWGTTLPEAFAYLSKCSHFRGESGNAVQWFNWWTTDGETGEEPPEKVKQLYRWVDEWASSVPGTSKYVELGQNIFDFHADQVWLIGTVGNLPVPATAKNNLRNIDMEGIVCNWFSKMESDLLPSQWFFETKE